MSTFPQPWRSTVSHWIATNRGPGTFWDHNRDAALPIETVDYAIIGGGITGASLAYALTRPSMSAKKVVLLEAKDLASGASGRNGGHVAPYSFVEFSDLTEDLERGGAGLDNEQALEVLAFEQENLAYTADTIDRNKWDCDFRMSSKLVVATTESGADQMSTDYNDWMKARENSRFKHQQPGWTLIEDREEVQRLTRTVDPTAVAKGPAGSVHPHKLTTCFLRTAMESGNCEFYSWCPVSSVSSDEKDKGWLVDCGSRGRIRAREVICCTNAHTAHLFGKGSDIDKHLTPSQSTAGAVTPTTSFSGDQALKYTYNIEDGPYLVQTPDGTLVFGPDVVTSLVGRTNVGETNDSFVREELKKWISDWCLKNFVDWGEQAIGEGGQRFWTGIVCYTRDTLPLVGEVPGEKGLWICAGFQGHGMGRIPQTTRCLANVLRTHEWDEAMPQSFKITKERMESAQRSPPYEKRGVQTQTTLE